MRPTAQASDNAKSTPPAQDADLVDIVAMRQGDENAFARIIARHESTIFTQMSRFSRDPLVQRELVQDVFVAVFAGIKGFRGDAPFLHWLRRIATRTGYRHWTQKSRARRLEQRIQAETASDLPPDPTPRESADWLYTLLAQLPTKDRLVLTLYYFEEHTTPEIADTMGWPEVLVRVRMHRARNRLKALLAATYPNGVLP